MKIVVDELSFIQLHNLSAFMYLVVNVIEVTC